MPMPVAASTPAGGTCASPATVLRTTGSSEYSVSAITAGAMPMPPMPRRPAPGCAPANASGAISSPNSAIDGRVWMTLSTANSGARGRCAAKQRDAQRNADQQRRQQRGGDDFRCRSNAAWKISCRFAYSLSSDSAIELARHQQREQGSSTAACASVRRAGVQVAGAAIASTAASQPGQHEPARSRRRATPARAATRAATGARASSPASQHDAASNSAAAAATSGVRPARRAKAATREQQQRGNGSSSARAPGSAGVTSGTPVPGDQPVRRARRGTARRRSAASERRQRRARAGTRFVGRSVHAARRRAAARPVRGAARAAAHLMKPWPSGRRPRHLLRVLPFERDLAR